MSYLLDTNVICELVKPVPSKKVLAWFEPINNERLFVSVLTLGEIRKGVECLPNSAKKTKLLIWLENELPAWFETRILPIDAAVADCWGRLEAKYKRPLPTIDTLLAATAIHHDLALITRNTRDFNIAALRLINPF